MSCFKYFFIKIGIFLIFRVIKSPKKISKLVADPDKYKKAVTKIADSIAEFDSINNGATREEYRGFVDSLTSAAKRGLKALGFDSTAEYIGGRELIKDKAGKVVNFREAMSGTVNLNRKMAFAHLFHRV